MRQAYQHTLVDDVAAAPVIDVGAFDRATDHVPAGMRAPARVRCGAE